MAYVYQAVDTDEPMHDTDLEQMGNMHLYGTISGGALTYDAADMTVDLGAGVDLHNGAKVTVAVAANAYTLVADGSNERWAALTVGSAGTAVLVSGDPAASSSVEPSKPEIGDRVLHGFAKIQAAQTVADNCEYKLDKRNWTHVAPNTPIASSDTPVATTSTSATDIVVISGLSIPVTSKVVIEIGHSKDALAAQVTALGVKVNATQVVDSTATTSGTQQAEDGLFIVELGPRTAASPGSLLLTRSSRITATNVEALAAVHSTGGTPGVCPVATITSLTITGLNSTANNNLTVEWYRVWELPV